MKKLISLLMAATMALSLCACGPSKATQDVIGKIDSLVGGEITIDSENLILEIDSAYHALSDKEKGLVANITAFDEAKARFEVIKKNEDIIAELNQSITKLGKLKATKVTEIDSAVAEIDRLYKKLDDEFQEKASKYDDLGKYIADSVVASVKALTKDSQTVSPTAILTAYKEYLSKSQKISCLGKIGETACVNDALSKLNRLNSGKNFSITNMKVSSDKFADGKNTVEGEITAYVTNVFGGGNYQTIYMYYTFDIDVEHCNVLNISGFSY